MQEIDYGEKAIELMKAIDKLPEEGQFAIYLSIRSLGLIRELCKNPGTSRERLEAYKQRYKEEGEYVGQILAGLALSYMDEAEQSGTGS